MIDNREFGLFLAEMRSRQGMKQIELARRLRVSDKTVSKWECGKGFPDIQLLQPLAQALDVSLVELFECRRFEAEALPISDANAALAGMIERSKTQLEAVYRLVRGVLLGLACLGFLVMLVCAVQLFMPVVVRQVLETGWDTALANVYGSAAMLYLLPAAGMLGGIFLHLYLWVADFTRPDKAGSRVQR